MHLACTHMEDVTNKVVPCMAALHINPADASNTARISSAQTAFAAPVCSLAHCHISLAYLNAAFQRPPGTITTILLNVHRHDYTIQRSQRGAGMKHPTPTLILPNPNDNPSVALIIILSQSCYP